MRSLAPPSFLFLLVAIVAGVLLISISTDAFGGLLRPLSPTSLPRGDYMRRTTPQHEQQSNSPPTLYLWTFSSHARSSESSESLAFHPSSTALFAKKKKKGAAAKIAALETLEALERQEEEQAEAAASSSSPNGLDLDFDIDAPLSKKEAMKLAKKKSKEAKKAQNAAAREQTAAEAAENNKKKDPRKAALKALEEMEKMEQEAAEQQEQIDGYNGESTKKLSKKELKKLAKEKAKKEEKMAAKLAKKEAKKQKKMEEVGEVDGETVPDIVANGDVAGVTAEPAPSQPDPPKKMTLEERIRKERPPPRIRVMESSQPNFSSLRLENVGIIFRDQQVLKDVTWGVQTGDRIGLVGQNGAGKTTQLRIMEGELEPTTGDVVKSSSDLRVAILRQEFVDELVLDRTLKDEFMSVFVEENQILEELRDLETKLEAMGTDDTDAMQEVLDKMQELQGKADDKDIYALEARAKKVMNVMGFTTEESDDLVSMFSGGWKMRIGLGKVLLKEPNILLLDEPTNHLDMESVEWLEDFLRNQKIPMVIVSHDREFLDQVCTKIVDADGGVCSEYDGNYSRFLKLKKARMDSWQAAYDAQEKKIKEEKAWINKFKIKQPQAVKQRQAQLEKKMKSDDYIKKPPFLGKPFRFRFPDAPRLSPEVAEVKGLSHSYGNGANRLFEDSDLFIEKGDRIAVIGPNGSGKSTLLRILMGKETPDEGRAEIVGQNIVANYFEQNQADALDLTKTVIETVQEASTTQSYNELRALLGQFLFKGDAVEKKVLNLSGGEKARLSLACMMLRPANLLVLDEPTNHLDIPAKEMLEEALQHFQGSVIVISHDRYFISKVATTIVAIEDKKLVKYGGDYKFYMDKSKHVKEKVEARYVKGVQKIGNAPIVDLEALEGTPKKKNFGGAKNANMVTRKNKGIKNAKRQKETTF